MSKPICLTLLNYTLRKTLLFPISFITQSTLLPTAAVQTTHSNKQSLERMVRTRSAPLHRSSHSLAACLSLPFNKTAYYLTAGKYHKFKICKLLYNYKNKYVQHHRVLLIISLQNSNFSEQSACFLKFAYKIFNLKPFRSVNKWRNTTEYASRLCYAFASEGTFSIPLNIKTLLLTSTLGKRNAFVP